MALITLVLLKVPYFFFIFQALWWNLIVLFDRLTCSLILLLSFSYKVLAQRPFLRACKIVRLCCFQKLSLAVPRTFGPWDGRSRTRSTVHGPSVLGTADREPGPRSTDLRSLGTADRELGPRSTVRGPFSFAAQLQMKKATLIQNGFFIIRSREIISSWYSVFLFCN